MTPPEVDTLLDLLTTGPGQPWQERGACRSKLDFFDERSAAVEAACAVCSGCPVAAQCGHYGTDERVRRLGSHQPG